MKKYFAPGRINLIGEHIDYNGGLVLPAAISLGITALVSESTNSLFSFSSSTHSETITFDEQQNFSYYQELGWLNYPLGVFQLLKQKQFTLRPLHIHFESSLPEGSGLSSSACIEVLTMFLLLNENDYQVSLKDIAVWSKEVENNFIGVNCGIMDQFCIANAKAANAMLLDCSELTYSHVPTNFGSKKLMILNTKKPRSLIHSKYNERRNECEQALALIQTHTNQNFDFLCECSVEHISVLEREILRKRARHVVTEYDRVKKAAYALTSGNILLFEELLNQSHQSLKHDYEVSGFELDTIVDIALQHNSCNAARMTGAGFGGCAIALVDETKADDFKKFVEDAYLSATGLKGEVYICNISEGVKLIV